MNFYKLKNKHNFSDNYKRQKSVVSYGKNIDESFSGINYSTVFTPDVRQMYSLIPEKYHLNFYVTLMDINSFIPPHVDTGVISTINFYIKSDNCVTQFYKFKPTADKSKISKKGYVYDLKDLEETDCFIAEDNSAYLLDTTQVHAVWDMGEKTRPIQMQLYYLYDDALVTDKFDLSKKGNFKMPPIKDEKGNKLELPSKYRDTKRVALCLQTRVHSFSEVLDMIQK